MNCISVDEEVNSEKDRILYELLNQNDETYAELREKPLKNLISQLEDSAPQMCLLQVECSSPSESRTRQPARMSHCSKAMRRELSKSFLILKKSNSNSQKISILVNDSNDDGNDDDDMIKFRNVKAYVTSSSSSTRIVFY